MPPSVSILLLAAGASERFGKPKQLLLFGGCSLLRRTAEMASSSRARSVLVVLGYQMERMRKELVGLPVEVIVNRQWKEGMASSIRAGVQKLPPSTEAVLITVCDQPLISVEILNTIMSVYESDGKRLVASEYGGTLGVPALFHSEFYPHLLRLQGDKGAREIIYLHRSRAARVPFPGGAIDIDKPADFMALQRQR
jgi:molybdenum cofactor cytidylyltransferase